MSDLFAELYNPDILTCLASLSNDEVFTPPDVANAMLDLLPQELFKSKETTFLDPAVKSGVFLREIAKRLIKGLETEIPDLQERLDHIFHKQIFGIAITELTSLLARRSLYCSKYPNGKYSISHFDDIQGNIRFKNTEHNFKDGRCTFCGASEEVFGQEARGELESHAYEFIHTDKPEEILNMKFDVIISNPPYQLSDGSGGSTDAAMPIYHKFVKNAKKFDARYVCMIIPSKWMVGGRGLEKFREEMISDKSMKYMCDFEDSKSCFNGVHLDGGACYFLLEKGYNGTVHYIYTSGDGAVIEDDRTLENTQSKFIVRDSRIIPFLNKVSKDISFSSIVSSTKPFGIRKDLFNNPNKYPNALFSDNSFKKSVHIFGVKGLKGGAKRTDSFISEELVTSNKQWVNKYKIFFTTSYSTDAITPPKPILGNKGDVCTETFLVIGPFESLEQRNNCVDYMNTAFFKFLLHFGKGSMQVTKSVFSYVPLQDFSKPWTDAELYEKYGLTQEEIDFIESMIRPMNEETDD